jgi:hypothetical protein
VQIELIYSERYFKFRIFHCAGKATTKNLIRSYSASVHLFLFRHRIKSSKSFFCLILFSLFQKKATTKRAQQPLAINTRIIERGDFAPKAPSIRQKLIKVVSMSLPNQFIVVNTQLAKDQNYL